MVSKRKANFQKKKAGKSLSLNFKSHVLFVHIQSHPKKKRISPHLIRRITQQHTIGDNTATFSL